MRGQRRSGIFPGGVQIRRLRGRMKLTRCGGYFFRRSVDFVDTNVRRGEIYYADLSPVVGSEQGGVRPVLIVQNDTGNRHSPTVIAAAITSQTGKAKLPTHIEVAAQCCGLPKDSVILSSRSVRWISGGCGSGMTVAWGRNGDAAGRRRHCRELRTVQQPSGMTLHTGRSV